MDTSKASEKINEEGAVEVNVETVDYRKPAGEGKEAVEEKVDVTHVIRTQDDKPAPTNFVAQAAGKVAEKLHSATAANKADDKPA